MSDTPLIALTAHVLIGDRERCLSAGMNGYVPKPFTPDSLFSEISRVLALRAVPVLAPEPSMENGPEPLFDPDADTHANTDTRPFARAQEGLGNDPDLFAEVATVAITEFDQASRVLMEMAQAADMRGLAGYAHRLTSNWALYAEPAQAELPAQLIAAAHDNDHVVASELVGRFTLALGKVVLGLHAWLAEHERMDVA